MAAAAYAFAAVLDRTAYGTLPSGVAGETLRQQAACLASALAARPGRLAGIPRGAPGRAGRAGRTGAAGSGRRLERQVDLSALLPRADLLVAAALLDAALGDPIYRWHPVRLLGASLAGIERGLRAVGADGRGGGCLLFAMLAALWVGGISAALLGAARLHPAAGGALHLFVLYSLLALGDLLAHGRAVERAAAAGDLPAARRAAHRLVGRDVDRMDAAACRRAAIESLAENLADGVVSPIMWYALLGIPGLVLSKVVSTMDSMVGYRTPRYLRFGWCGARLDDLLQAAPGARDLAAYFAGGRACCPAAPAGVPCWSAGATMPCCPDPILAGARRPWPAPSGAGSSVRYGSAVTWLPRHGSAILPRPPPGRQPTIGGRKRLSAS